MGNIFVVSDTHFGHSGILEFKQSDGSPLRNFNDVNEMNEFIISRWNETVKPGDKIYHLGDVAMKDTEIKYLSRLNGKKRLILGNHDYGNMKLYMPFFEDIYSSRRLDKIILSHFPIHPNSMSEKVLGNAHGHIHSPLNNIPDPRYYNVCVENLNYTPIAFEDLKKRIEKQIRNK